MNAHYRQSAAEWLQSNSVTLRDLSPGDHKTVCPRCSAQRKNKREPCLSVTIRASDDVVVNCHHCGWSEGNRTMGGRPVERRTYSKPKPPEKVAQPGSLMEWFGKRAISAETVKAFGIHKTKKWFPQPNSEVECIAFPYLWNGELVNAKYRTADKQFIQEKNPQPTLYNVDRIAEDLIFVEGEIDVLAFYEAGYPSCVSLPNGAPSGEGAGSDKRYEPLATHEAELSRVRKVYIATDTDAPGEVLAQELARRLGRDRCFRVRFDFANDVSYKDANEALIGEGPQGLLACLEGAEPWPIDGLHGVNEYAGELQDLYEGKGPQPLSTGFIQFNDCFRVIPGQFVVVTGIPNHGKSRFVDQVAVQMSERHDWFWGVFSPETGEANHIADLCEIRVGKPFFVGPNSRMSPEEMADAREWVAARFAFIATGDHTPTIDWVLERARALVLRNGMNALIVDPYNEIEAGRPKEMTETEFVSQLISKCKRFARLFDVAVFMIVHPTKLRPAQPGQKEPVPGLYDLSGSAHWRNKADAGLVVYRDYEAGKTTVFSKKIRRQPVCGEPGSVDFEFRGVERRFEEISHTRKNLGAL